MTYQINELMATVFLEQPRAWPGALIIKEIGEAFIVMNIFVAILMHVLNIQYLESGSRWSSHSTFVVRMFCLLFRKHLALSNIKSQGQNSP